MMIICKACNSCITTDIFVDCGIVVENNEIYEDSYDVICDYCNEENIINISIGVE